MKRHLYNLLSFFMLMPIAVLAHVEEDNYFLTSVEPADGSTLAILSKGDLITFSTNADSIFGGFNVVIWDSNKNNIVYEDFTVSKNVEGKWVLSIYENLPLLKGHTYQVEMTGHEGPSSKSPAIAKFVVSYVGNGTASGEEDDTDYEYSNIGYRYFSPVDGSAFDNILLNKIILTFTGEVNIDVNRSIIIDEDGNEHQFEQISPFHDSEEQWELYVSRDFLYSCSSYFKVHVFAKDKGGRAVKGNRGKGVNSYYELTYSCDFGYPQLSVIPNRGNMRYISDFSFTHQDGIAIKDENQFIRLYKEDRQTVLLDIASSELELIDSINSLTYHLTDTLKTEGVYYLHVPDSTFLLSHRMLPNREMWMKYEVVDRLGMYGVATDPEEGSTLPSLSRIYITFYRWDAVGPYYQNHDVITVTNELGDTVAIASADYDKERIVKNQCFIDLKKPVTKSGHYFVNVPAKAFILGSDARYMSEAMYFEFDVEAPPAVIPEFAVATELDDDYALRHILVQFLDYDYVRVADYRAEASLKDSLDNEVAKGKLYVGRYRNQLCITLDDDYKVAEENDFILTLPAYSVSLETIVYEEALAIPVHYDPTTGIRFADAGRDSRVRVYSLQGTLVREGLAGEVLRGLKGVYIVNGKKMVLQ